MKKYKQGEKEAKKILENLGIDFDDEYYDDNSHKSMPDLRTKDGLYIEVTHTIHNNEAVKFDNKFHTPLTGESYEELYKRQADKGKECSKAIERVRKFHYKKNSDGSLTPEGVELFDNDCTLIKEHLGYDLKECDINKRHSEFKCDRPSFDHSTENIVEIINKKAKKHSSRNISLFVFATEDEFRLMRDLLNQVDVNAIAKGFLQEINNSPFSNIYICEWDFIGQKYEVDNPLVIRFSKDNAHWREY